MNQILENLINQIEQQLDQVEDTLADSAAEVQRQREARDKLLNQFWSRGKQLTVLNEATKSYETLLKENERLKETQQELQDRLGRVLEYSKVLREALRQ